jgi:hypothetical protein
MLQNGVAFECHPQNCVARFDVHTKELKGFIIRDFGGLRVHRETLLATTGVELDFLDGHSIIAADLDDVYTRMYHTVFHNHLQQLIRVLGLHYNGRGWKIVRDQLGRSIPPDHPLYKAWLCPDRTSLPGKCFLRMRMAGMYRFVSLSPISLDFAFTQLTALACPISQSDTLSRCRRMSFNLFVSTYLLCKMHLRRRRCEQSPFDNQVLMPFSASAKRACRSWQHAKSLLHFSRLLTSRPHPFNFVRKPTQFNESYSNKSRVQGNMTILPFRVVQHLFSTSVF